MKYIIGREVYNLMSESALSYFNEYLNENEIKLNIVDNAPFTALQPVNLNHQVSLISLYEKNEWFENIVNSKLISKYFYKSIDNYTFDNSLSLGKLNIIEMRNIEIPYQKVDYGDYIFIHNFEYNITLAGKVFDIFKDSITLFFHNLVDIAQTHTVEFGKPIKKYLDNIGLRTQIGAPTYFVKSPIKHKEPYGLVEYWVNKNLKNKKLEFHLIYPNPHERILLELNAYRLFDRIKEVN